MDRAESNLPGLPGDGSAYPTPWQRKILWTALVTFAVLTMLAAAGLTFWGFILFLSWSYPILLPLGLSVIIALVLEPVVDFLQRRKVRRSSATLFVCALAVVAFMDFWVFLLPPVVRQTGEIIKRGPEYLDTGFSKLQGSLGQAPAAKPPTRRNPTPSPAPDTSSPIKDFIHTNVASLRQELPSNALHVFYAGLGPIGQAIGFIVGFAFVPIYVYYLLADEDYIQSRWHEWVPLRHGKLRDEVIVVVTEIGASIVAYFRGQIIVSATNGVLLMIGLSCIGVPFGLVLGLVAGVLSIVPYLGILISIIPALFLAFTSANGDPTWQWLGPVLVLTVFAVVQTCESMIVTPRVQSHTTGLHPVVIILGILIWSMLLPGLLGPIVAVPLTCALVVLVRRYLLEPGKSRKKSEAGAAA